MALSSRLRAVRCAIGLLATSACGGGAVALDAAAPDVLDASAARDAAGGDGAVDAVSAALRRCPTSGRGAIEGDHCFVLTPAESGLPASGANAGDDQYALRPTGDARGQLLLFFNGSGGSPRGAIASAATSFYSVARAQGLHVLAVSYRSDDAIGTLCALALDRDACFLQTRTTVLTGEYQDGAAASLRGISRHEGVYARALAALVALAQQDPGGGWDAFFDASMLATPQRAIRWERVLASGHSQGGGHAALLGRRHALARVIALASPCDNTRGAPAQWLVNDGAYATDPATRFVGLGAPGDTICPAYAAVWESLRMAPAARIADAVVCAESAHGAPVACAENAGRWARLLQR